LTSSHHSSHIISESIAELGEDRYTEQMDGTWDIASKSNTRTSAFDVLISDERFGRGLECASAPGTE
jgi:hypothetical protein